MSLTSAPLEEQALRISDDVDAVEIKVTIRPDQELRAERALEVDADTAEVRVIYFFDTPKLDLFNAGVSLRARLVKGDDDDSTVKFRPVEPEAVPAKWRDEVGFKLEVDRVGEKALCTASFTVVQQRDEIDEVAEGRRAIAKLFSREQEEFLREFHPAPVDLDGLSVLGPIRALRWKLKRGDFPYKVTVEEWRLPNGDDLVEASIKTTPDDAGRAQAAFVQFLTELRLDPKGAAETKTRTALEYFAKTLHH
ncbi:hypothetical protein [Caulobacter sp. 17J65-9]|uniref:hypothetical protein n=1 Tax=Caulobacter sp. 17J65-9 TaxID=2709382 RepID=UPI0013C86FC9|nr:hypothetical protein [Caulobacter sp. 17J65-9]NEX92504.1 hypothetical protein [Caulobacter sp. 17J65-9]